MNTNEQDTVELKASIRGHEVPLGLFVNGRWATTGSKFAVTNPATGETISEVADGTDIEALAALDAAVAAQTSWGSMAPRDRANLFHKAHALMLSRADAFADLMTLESGKPRSESMGEFSLSMDFFQWYAEQIAHLHGTYQQASRGGFRVITAQQPVGPSFLITPWNFPMLMNARKGGAALAAGCTIILKSAKETPLTAAYFVQSLDDAGFPPGVVNLIHTSGSAVVSEAIMKDARLRKISFTGSTDVGSTLLKQASRNIINTSMELGGDGPFIVLADADVDLAVHEAVICKFRNAGQACVAANRIILHSSISAEFTEKFVAAARELRVGDGFDPGVEVGPMINARQRERVEGLVSEFQQIDGVKLLTGGQPVRGAGYYYQPTVLSFPNREHALCNEETFAPVAALYTVDSTAEAIAFANNTHYGLASYIFTCDVALAVTVAEKLDFGMVGINRGIMAEPSAPFGGTKASGLGREGGHEGIQDFLEPKYIALTVNEGIQS